MKAWTLHRISWTALIAAALSCSQPANSSSSAAPGKAAATSGQGDAAATARGAPAPPAAASQSGDKLAAPVACSSAGLAAANQDCLSPTCARFAARLTRCSSDDDCQVGTFATCECHPAGPHYSINKKSFTAADRKQFADVNECRCGCAGYDPVCIEGTCGFKNIP